jgi:hypothetical protein
MAAKYQLMIDPTPSGWAYGFPKALPDEALVHGDKAYDMFIDPSFDLTKWVVEQGYPEEHFAYYRLFPQEIEDEAAEKMGDLKFTTAGDYIYPGSDCQE